MAIPIGDDLLRHGQQWLAGYRDKPAVGGVAYGMALCGDPISAARALYRKAARCVPNSPDKTAPHPHCRITVPAGALLIGGDPIRTMTLVRR